MHRDDVPAALPLIAFAAGLLSGQQPWAFFAIALLLCALRRVRFAIVAAAFASAALLASHHGLNRRADARTMASLDQERFVTVSAPLDHDWSRRDGVSTLRVAGFRIGQTRFHTSLALYTRFPPEPIGLSASITAEGFLRHSEKGSWVMSIKSPRLLAYHDRLSPWNPARWNRTAAMRLDAFARDFPDEVALVEALALGRSERLSDALRDNFKRGGTYHLLVFSGLQIALAAACIAGLLRWFHAPRAADWSLLIFALAAPLFIGPSASVWRASICIALFAASRIAKRPTSLANLWCLSALIRLALAPEDLSDAAFHLTYAGAGAIIFAGRPLAGNRWRWVAFAVAAELTITPLTLFHFHQYALGGSIMTMLLTPVVFAMLIVAAVICLAPCVPLLALIGLLDRICLSLNDLSAHASGVFATPPPWVISGGFAGAMFSIAFLRGRARALAILGFVSLPLFAAWWIDAGRRSVAVPHVIALDAGQGDAILLRSGKHNVLVDGGPNDSILPLLADRGVRRLDIVLLTHAHPDHCGGLVSVIQRMDAGQLWLSPRRFRGDCAVRLLAAAASRGTPIHLVHTRDTVTIAGFRISTLLSEPVPRHSPENNSSIVTEIQIEKTRLLLTGDIERESESALLGRVRRADVLKIAHHGSRTSSTAAFLDAVSPRLALISCGRHNLFGHPHPTVVAALRARGIRILRTDQLGSIDLRVDGNRIAVVTQIDTPP